MQDTDNQIQTIANDSMAQVHGGFANQSNNVSRTNKRLASSRYYTTEYVDSVVTYNDLLLFIIEEVPSTAFKLLPDLKNIKPNVEKDLLDYYIDNEWDDKLRLVSTLARRYGAAYIVLDLNDGLDYTAPVNYQRNNTVLRTFTLTQEDVRASRSHFAFYEDPEYYQVTIGTTIREVHKSRILCFYGNKLVGKNLNYNGNYHRPIWVNSFPFLNNYEVSISSATEMMKDINVFLYSYKGLHDLLELARSGKANNAKVVNQLIDRLSLLADGKSITKSMILDQEKESGEFVDRNFANLEKVIEVLKISFAERTEYPMSVLFKSANGNLFSETGSSDRYSFAGTVNKWQRQNVSKPLRQLFKTIDTRTKSLRIDYPSTITHTQEENAQATFTIAKALSSNVVSGIMTPSIAARAYDGSSIKSHIQMSGDEIKEATESAEAKSEMKGVSVNENVNGSVGEGVVKSN